MPPDLSPKLRRAARRLGNAILEAASDRLNRLLAEQLDAVADEVAEGVLEARGVAA